VAAQNLFAARWHGAATAVRPADSGSGLGAGILSDCVAGTKTLERPGFVESPPNPGRFSELHGSCGCCLQGAFVTAGESR